MTEDEHNKVGPPMFSCQEVRYVFVNFAYMSDNNNHVKGINSIGPHKVKANILSVRLFFFFLYLYFYLKRIKYFSVNAY